MLEGGAIDISSELPAHDEDHPQDIAVISLEDLLTREFPPRENLLEPWLPKQGLCMIFASRGVGKTHVALGIAYAVASGGEFLMWKASQPRKVLYLDGEMPAAAIQERLAATAISSGKTALPGYLKIINPDLQEWAMPDLSSGEGQKALEPYLEDVDLIIVDNISTLCRSGAENKADDWGDVQAWALRQRAQGRSILFIHHAGKGGAQRGTSKREDVLDTVISLKHPMDYEPNEGAKFEIHFEKSRGIFGDDVDSMLAHLKPSHDGPQCWSISTLEESTYDKVISLANEGLSQREITEELGINKSNVSRHFRRAKADGRIQSKGAA